MGPVSTGTVFGGEGIDRNQRINPTQSNFCLIWRANRLLTGRACKGFHCTQQAWNLSPLCDGFRRVASMFEGVLILLWCSWGQSAVHAASADTQRSKARRWWCGKTRGPPRPGSYRWISSWRFTILAVTRRKSPARVLRPGTRNPRC